MFGKMNPKRMKEMMKKLNMNIEELRAEEVIIKCKEKNIVISKPEIMVTNMAGKDIYQITGEVSESKQASEEDIKIVMEKTGKNRGTVAQKLEELNNDLAKAIMELKKK